MASEVSLLQKAVETASKRAVHFYLSTDSYVESMIHDINELSSIYKGIDEGYVHLINGEVEAVIYLGKAVLFEASEKLKSEAERRFGPSSIIFNGFFN
ncbi:MAG: hypothetical protein PHN75_14490 [Syntrophales bacterium]|nr:hypothetical protein [Syntrophales bacterium]